jgi:hypothetical protein
MVSEKFIRCCNCEAVHHVTSFDKSPIYSYVGNQLHEEAADDWRGFMQQHAGHRLEPLTITGERFFPSGSLTDPMSTGYIEVTNGRDRFLLRRTRKSIEEPLTFEVTAGQLSTTGITLEVQEKEIRNEMKHHFWPGPDRLTDEQIDLFVRILKELVQGIDPRTIRLSEASYTDDNVSYGQLDHAAIESLMTECAKYFLPYQLDSIRRFIEAHRESCDVMTLIMRWQWTIEQPAG